MTCCCCKLEKVSSSPGGALTQCIIQSCIKQSSISDLNCRVLSFPFPAARAASSAWQCPVCPRMRQPSLLCLVCSLLCPVSPLTGPTIRVTRLLVPRYAQVHNWSEQPAYLTSKAVPLLSLVNTVVCVEVNASVDLGCEYELGGEQVYSLKWYRDHTEIFRWQL